MSKQKWRGHLGKLMERHLELRSAVGRVIATEAICLHQLNQFILKKYPSYKTIERMVLLDYLHSIKHHALSGRKAQVSYIRQFCRFLIGRGVKCYVPDKTLLPKYEYRPRYCPLTEVDIKRVMQKSREVKTLPSFMREAYACVFGLLWCTGMRRREVENLKHEDVDLDRGILLIRQTKFFKDRFVPLGPSVVAALKKYVARKNRNGYPTNPKAAFFVNRHGGAMSGSSISHFFNKIVKQLELKSRDGRSARVHDFRHNFASQTMARIYREPEKFAASPMMARLATYLGHVSIYQTQYYLHPDFNLMQEAASSKFGWSK